MNKDLQLAIESQGWTVVHDGGVLEICQHSPAGEDFCFYVNGESTEEFIADICRYAIDFDIDEHASMHIEHRGKFGTPSSVSVLVRDAEAINDMLMELADAVKKVSEV